MYFVTIETKKKKKKKGDKKQVTLTLSWDGGGWMDYTMDEVWLCQQDLR